jgi:hypothetical protein
MVGSIAWRRPEPKRTMKDFAAPPLILTVLFSLRAQHHRSGFPKNLGEEFDARSPASTGSAVIASTSSVRMIKRGIRCEDLPRTFEQLTSLLANLGDAELEARNI